MQCSYCHLRNSLPLINMTEEIAYKAIAFCLDSCSTEQCIDLHLTGGEPFLNECLIKKITNHFSKDSRISIRITTNGTLLNKKICEFIKDNNIMVSISVDGNREVHGMHRRSLIDYSVIFENMKMLIDMNCMYEIGIGLHPQGLNLTIDSMESFVKIGAKNFRVVPIYGNTVLWDDEAIKKLLDCYIKIADLASLHNINISPFDYNGEHVGEKFKNLWGCSAGCKTIAVLPDGKIVPCSALAPFVSSNPILLQGIIPSGLTKNNSDFCSINQSENTHQECQGCSARNNCLGGCPAINLSSTGNMFSPPKWYCDMIKFFPVVWNHRWGKGAYN